MFVPRRTLLLAPLVRHTLKECPSRLELVSDIIVVQFTYKIHRITTALGTCSADLEYRGGSIHEPRDPGNWH
jgi:hypothetical protein